MIDSGHRPRVLLATRRDWLAASIEGVLDQERFEVGWSTEVDVVASPAEASRPDGVLLDQELAGDETPALCRRIVRDWLGEHTPLIVYSSDLRDEDLQTRIVEAGAWTVIQEPIRSRHLLATIQRFLRIGRSVRKAATVNGRRDVSTDLPTVDGLLERLSVLEALAERNETSIALVAVGPRKPGAGDLLERQRRQTAELCGEVLRSSDLFGWLDDEGDVVIAAYGAGEEDARSLAERLARRAAERSQVERPEDALSIGIVAVRPGRDFDVVRAGKKSDEESALVEAAHEALHRARASGGGIKFGS